MEQETLKNEYKPNIYPIMYWALLYGALSALALFVLKILSDFITILWFPVFLAGLVWGGFRKYKQDKTAWMQGKGIVGTQKSAVDEFKDAARDITLATQEMVSRHAQEDAKAVVAAQEAQTQQDTLAIQDEAALPDSAPVAPQAPETPSQPEEIITQEPEVPKSSTL